MARRQSSPSSAAPFIAFVFGIIFAAMAAMGLLAVQHRDSADGGRSRLAFLPPSLELPDAPIPMPIPYPRT